MRDSGTPTEHKFGTSGVDKATEPNSSLLAVLRTALGKGRATAIQNAIENEPPAHKLADEVAIGKKPFDDALDAVEQIVWLLQEVRGNVAELADDLKGFYEPEKGWPPQIDKASEMLAEIDDALRGVQT